MKNQRLIIMPFSQLAGILAHKGDFIKIEGLPADLKIVHVEPRFDVQLIALYVESADFIPIQENAMPERIDFYTSVYSDQ